jgi:Ca-activated chloride channel family protein
MADELEQLRDALRREPSEPRPAARQAAIAAALAAHDEKFAPANQGSRVHTRLMGAAQSAWAFLRRRGSMRLAPAMAGGVSLVALTLALVTTGIVSPTLWRSPTEEPVERTVRLADAERQEERRDAAGQSPQPAPPPALVQQAPEGFAPPQALAPSQMAQADRSTRGGEAVNGFAAPAAEALDEAAAYYREQGRDRFAAFDPNPVKIAAEDPVSTFSIDVDTASYAFVRAALNQGVLPQKDAVRVEELINYFDYDYPQPQAREVPFRASVSVFPTPWNEGTKLLHIGIKGYELPAAEAPRANLVFLVDTSGSMDSPDKLPLLANSLRLLLGSLRPDDTVAIVTYAGDAGIALAPTPVAEQAKIIAALDGLGAGGSTAGAEGIRQAYQLAEQNFDKAAVNRVFLATDGDFNVGITDPDELKGFIERKRDSGIYLSVLGFGRGNYNDALMQALAQNGNGAAAYIDTLNEARRVLVEEASATLFPIAKDVKLQVEFNPAVVSEYRLIGYETRLLAREDFNNDRVDAGEIGSGHSVTAIYEITPTDSGAELVEPLRYGQTAGPDQVGEQGEYAYLKIRYKLPEEDASRLIETPVTQAMETSLEAAPREARFAAAVAAFGQLLRGGRYTEDFGYDDVIRLAHAARGTDPFGLRTEFINLVRLAKSAAAIERLDRR